MENLEENLFPNDDDDDDDDKDAEIKANSHQELTSSSTVGDKSMNMGSEKISSNYVHKLIETISKHKTSIRRFSDDFALENMDQLIELEATRELNFPGPTTSKNIEKITIKVKKLSRRSNEMRKKKKRINYDYSENYPVISSENNVKPRKKRKTACKPTVKVKQIGKRYLTEVPGYRMNTKVFNEEETSYLFKVNKKSCERAYMSCISSNCSARIIADVIPGDNTRFIVTDNRKSRPIPHNHMPSEVEYNTLILVGRCKNRALNTSEDIRTIFESELTRFEENIPNITYNSIEASLHKIRSKSHPGVPQTIDELAQGITESRYRLAKEGGDFYHTYLKLDDGSNTIVFISPFLKAHINSPHIEEIYLDSSFKLIPGPPNFTQMFTIHFGYCDYSFPVLYALMSTNSEMAYTSILAHFRTVCPALQPHKIITDYNEQMMKAAWHVFGDIPNISVVGSMFHFYQFLFRKLFTQEVGLMDTYRNGSIQEKTLLHSCFALPLLNPPEMYWGLSAIQEETKQLTDGPVKDNIMAFLQYLLDFWMNEVTPMVFSVNNDFLRTSNAMELFLISFRDSVTATNINIWSFIGKLIDFDNRETKYYQIIESGMRTPRKIKAKFLLKITVIKDLRQKLTNAAIDVSHFLSNVAFHIFEKLERNKPILDYVDC